MDSNVQKLGITNIQELSNPGEPEIEVGMEKLHKSTKGKPHSLADEIQALVEQKMVLGNRSTKCREELETMESDIQIFDENYERQRVKMVDAIDDRSDEANGLARANKIVMQAVVDLEELTKTFRRKDAPTKRRPGARR